jgi:hypothetical protein
VEGWEWEAVADSLKEESGAARSWQALVVEGLALQAKGFDGVDAAATGQGAAPIADLELDAVMAFKLQREIQKTVEQMIVGGRIAQAKKLTQFKRRLADTVSAIGNVIGEGALAEADALATASPFTPLAAAFEPVPKELTHAGQPEGAGSQTSGLDDLLALEERLERRATGETACNAPASDAALADEGRQVPWRTVLLCILAGVLGVWLSITLWMRSGPAPLADFTLGDFRHPALREVNARPPSLYVTVDAELWSALAPETRREFLETVTTKVQAAGYTGVHVKDTTGTTVARWLRERGLLLVEAKAAEPT